MSTTIPVSRRTKRELEKLKGSRSWDEFLLDLVSEYRRGRMEAARRELNELLELEYEDVRVRRWTRES
ncbi:MAG: hypothetical protein DRO01_07305 [Thermoproteota archaeon]|nr:MAG: hypothetical protein DRO01_07305 [Candidatus Korarchaeota archaeon]